MNNLQLTYLYVIGGGEGYTDVPVRHVQTDGQTDLFRGAHNYSHELTKQRLTGGSCVKSSEYYGSSFPYTVHTNFRNILRELPWIFNFSCIT